MQRVSSMTVSLSVLLAPEFAALIGWLFFKERITLTLVLSIILVLAGVLISVMGEKVSWLRNLQNKFKMNHKG